jgi:hypothetical protein
MTPKRLFFVLLIGFVLGLGGLVGASYAVVTMITTKSKTLADRKSEVVALQSQQTSLAKSKRDVAKYADLEKITDGIVPQDKDQAQTVRELTRIAAANKISLTTISFPSSTLGASSNGPAVASAATTAKPNLSQLTPVKNIPGVYNLQITLGNNGANSVTFNQLDAFLRGLENNRRTAAVSGISIQPQTDNPNRLVFTLVINTYIKPS